MGKSKKAASKSETKKASKPKNADAVVIPTPVTQAEVPAVQPVQEQPAAQPAAAPTKAPRAAKSAPALKAPREERNGVKRPKAGGKCDAVWQYLDANPTTTAKDIREVAASRGWNLNNAQVELSVWRKFMGIAKVTAPAK